MSYRKLTATEIQADGRQTHRDFSMCRAIRLKNGMHAYSMRRLAERGYGGAREWQVTLHITEQAQRTDLPVAVQQWMAATAAGRACVTSVPRYGTYWTVVLPKSRKHPRGTYTEGWSLRDTVNQLKSEIASARAARKPRVITYLTAYFGQTLRRVTGYHVHKSPGEILAMQEVRQRDVMFRDYKPRDASPWVAVELECLVKADCVGNVVSHLIKNKSLHGHVTVKHDGSIEARDGFTGRELVVCGPQSQIKALVANVTSVLLTYGDARVNASCGLHVHLDQRGLDFAAVKQRYANLVRAQGLMLRLVSKSRQDNSFCKRSGEWQSGNRYKIINAHAYSKHKTLEVRLHQGSLDAIKICNWIDLLLAIQDKPATNSRAVRSTAKWLSRYVGPQLTAYWLERRSALGYVDAAPVSRRSPANDVAVTVGA